MPLQGVPFQGPSAAACRRRAHYGQAPKARLELRCSRMQASYNDAAPTWAAQNHNAGVFLHAICQRPACMHIAAGDRQGLDCLPRPQALCLKTSCNQRCSGSSPGTAIMVARMGAASYLATCPRSYRFLRHDIRWLLLPRRAIANHSKSCRTAAGGAPRQCLQHPLWGSHRETLCALAALSHVVFIIMLAFILIATHYYHASLHADCYSCKERATPRVARSDGREWPG